MKHITILATKGSNLGSIDNPRRGFLFVNDYLRKAGKPPMFHLQIAGLSNEIHLENGFCTLHPDIALKNLKKTDLIIIPAIDGDIEKSIAENQACISWLVKQYRNGAEIASLCVGAFLLAATGLLNGRSCSTHWRAANDFRKLFPEVELLTEKVITDESGLYTSGGAFSSANLILYLIEKYAGREIAIQCSKMFQVDMDRQCQSPFIIFQGQKEHEDEPVKQAQEFIENNYQEKITVEQLASKCALSRRNLERRFKKATANTVVEYMQRVRIEAVKKQLETGNQSINELMYDIGYSDTKAFRNLFKRYTGLSPIAYKSKYNREFTVA